MVVGQHLQLLDGHTFTSYTQIKMLLFRLQITRKFDIESTFDIQV